MLVKNAHHYIVTFFLTIPLLLNSRFVQISNIQQFNNEVVSSGIPAILKFSAHQCPPCQKARGPFKKVANNPEFSDIIFAEIDIGDNTELANKFSINSIPSFVFVQGNRTLGQQLGFERADEFIEKLSKNIRYFFSIPPAESNKTKLSAPIVNIRDEDVQEYHFSSIFLKMWQSVTQFFTTIGQYMQRAIVSIRQKISVA